MANFIPSKKEATDFNSGVQYVNGDVVQAETINNLVESALYSQNEAESAMDIANDAMDKIDEAISTTVVPNGTYPNMTVGYVQHIPSPAVGAHYIQFAGDPSPAEIWAGTTWVIDTDYAGRTIIGSGQSYSLGGIGGAATHTHDISNLVAAIELSGSGGVYAQTRTVQSNYDYMVNTNGSGASITQTINGGTAVNGSLGTANNIPPYKVVNIWKRTI